MTKTDHVVSPTFMNWSQSIRRLAGLLAVITLVGAAPTVRAEDATKTTLPKVALIGDSIRLSYSDIVAKQLGDSAVVISPKANGGDSGNVLKNLEQWVIKEQPAIVHFNCGIHDTKKFTATGRFQVSPEQYEANLRRIVERLRAETSAVIIFATTTTILDDRAAATRQGRDYELLGASVKQYNDIARKVMQELKVPVNDLHATLAKPPAPLTTETLIGTDGVHLTVAARELLGQQVAELVTRSLVSPR